MITRQQQVIKSAFIGGATGFVFGGAVGYLISDTRICSLVPGYFDSVLAQSATQLNKKLAEVTTTQADLLKNKLHSATDSISYLFQEGSRMKTAMDAVKFMADKIPSDIVNLPNIGSFVTKTLTFTNPILTTLSSTALDVTIDILKTGLVASCVDTMNQYQIIPVVCLGSTLVGASIGALVGLANSFQTTETISDRSSIKKSFLDSQSLFSNKMKNIPQIQLQHRRHQSRGLSSLYLPS